MIYPERFWLALGFYTRLPCPPSLDYRQLPQAAVFLPMVGWLVGALSGAAFYLAALLWPPTVAAVIALIAGIWITGAFHEDGFADVCDGFGGGYGKERILAIMKDSAIGVYGTLGLMLLLLLKVGLLGSMDVRIAPWILLSGHSVSRLMPLLLMRRYRYARTENSKSGGAMFMPRFADLSFAMAIALLPFVFLPAGCLLAALPPVFSTLWLGRYFNRHIDGYTGDCLGACQQVAEIVFYLGIGALWTSI
ncbi:adenosylcobinamide-GDP ribazoletransferase [Candidatus Methylomicrobium oryzae]|uniref:adenosylcobinamide-GDP ribazoletransferase n=1 Tax=Candidatus Methylomicrobium oryzae TaxID=2802053 RepID=UPI001922BA62|nr:adenosylcobinamide-GDP ribazoletransferase [Methylomicrobium sp. RS1]MBL1265564.1 adenosylcobinamide-GDP ribazoletransferase [Methylomicrobium sp. RS1]